MKRQSLLVDNKIYLGRGDGFTSVLLSRAGGDVTVAVGCDSGPPEMPAESPGMSPSS